MKLLKGFQTRLSKKPPLSPEYINFSTIPYTRFNIILRPLNFTNKLFSNPTPKDPNPVLSLLNCLSKNRPNKRTFNLMNVRHILFADVNECSTNSHRCDVNAVCTNNQGSHTCSCKAGYSGNGETCTGKCNTR